LLRQGRAGEARGILAGLARAAPQDAEVPYQIARSHLMEFYEQTADPARARVSLGLAMEALAQTLRLNPNHINALKSKSVIHARAELLHYDPDQAYDLAARVARLQPYANEFLVNVSEWMSGEVRFTQESGHRVPHDPLLGLDRAISLLDRVIDGAMPYSNEESAAYFQMAKTLSRRGDFTRSLNYYQQSLKRSTTLDQRVEIRRELGASLYRSGRFEDAASQFYEMLQLRPSTSARWLLEAAMEPLAKRPEIPERFRFERLTASPETAPLVAFEDMAPALGLDRLDGNGTCAWGDIDNDGDQDLILAGSGTFLAVYQNERGGFTERTQSAGLHHVPSGYSINLIDFNNDGWLDLYLSLNGWSGPMRNRLFRNTGGRFEDVTQATGAGDEGSGFVSIWGDLDNDGFLDLVVANGVLKDGSTPQVYRNDGGRRFVNMTRPAGIDEPPTWGAIGVALGDYDRDGDLDILINGLNEAPNRLYRNEGRWRFTEVTRAAGLTQPPHNGFVCFFFDYNNDGWPDVLTTSLAPWEATVEGLARNFAVPSVRAVHPDATRLFRNNGNGAFSDVTFEARLYHPMGVMGAGVADLDNDGYLDLYFGTGDPQLSRLEPNRFFRNQGGGTFVDATSLTPFSRPGRKGHGVSFVDIDNDGDLDLYAQLGGHYPGDHARNAFYRNLRGNRNQWLAVDLTGRVSNRFAVGAVIDIETGGRKQTREIKGSEGFGATNPYRQHFGLGQAAQVDRVTVRWPSGATETLTNVAAGKVLSITEKEPPR